MLSIKKIEKNKSDLNIEWSDGDQYSLARHYFLIAGYYHEINTVLSLKPA